MKQKDRKLFLVLLLLMAAAPVAAGGDGGHGFDMTMFAAKVVNFLVFFGGLWFLLRHQISEFFTNRAKQIREDLELAEKSREDAKRRLDEIESKMANLDTELAEIAAAAKTKAEADRVRIKQEAEQEAARIVAQAEAEVENKQREAVKTLKAFVTELAVAQAEKRIVETMTDEERKALFINFTKRLEARS